MIPVKILKVHPDAEIPEYKTPGACAFDLALVEDAVIAPGEVARLRTGLVFCVPPGHALLVASRSSMPKKTGLIIPHGFGLIDEDYCGPEDELLLQVQNPTDAPVSVKKGDRLMQGLIVPIARAAFETVASLETPSRGGFGTTG
jgi:dUTP pyrophosphatase